MSIPALTLNKFALALPDIPRWVETRSMLLSGHCEIFGLEKLESLCFVVRSTETKLISVVGRPAKASIQKAVFLHQNTGVVLAPPENSSHVAGSLPGWNARPAAIHLLGDAPHFPDVPEGMVRFLDETELDSIARLPSDLYSELVIASRHSPIAATFIDGGPVSFCYAGAETESLWDISIDTLVDYRNRGYAAFCFSYLARHMSRRGKQPVWGAEQSNLPSMRLASKLGFVPVDQLIVFQPVSHLVTAI